MAMLLAVVVSVMGASVEVAVEAPCVEAAFSGRLANAGVVLPADTTLSLRRARAEVLEVTLTPKGAAPMRREVPAAARDCAGVERVVVALVKAWLVSPVMVARAGRDGGAPRLDGGAVVDGLPVLDGGASVRVEAGAGSSVRAAVDAGSDGRAGNPVRVGVDPPNVDGRPGTSSRGDEPAPVRGAVDGGQANPNPPRGDVEVATTPVRAAADGGVVTPVGPGGDGPARLVADTRFAPSGQSMPDGGTLTSPRDAGVPADLGPSRIADGVTAADAGSALPRWSFGVGLLGGIASGTTTDIVPQGLLSVDVTRGWFGAALDVGLSGNVSRQVPPGAVTSSWQWLSLSARAVWVPLQRVTLDAQLGLRAHRIVALATGYAETKPEQQLLSAGAVGSVGASVRIVGPVGLTVRASGVVKPPERFTIDNLGAVLDLGALEGGVHAGVVVRW